MRREDLPKCHRCGGNIGGAWDESRGVWECLGCAFETIGRLMKVLEAAERLRGIHTTHYGAESKKLDKAIRDFREWEAGE